MRFTLPGRLHGWRKFGGEIAIIVFGVLIALAAGQLAEDWNWSRKVSEARQRLAPELGEGLGQAVLYERVLPCTERRLDEIATIVADAQKNGRLPPLGDVGQTYWFTWTTGVWQSLVADQTATHFKHDEAQAYVGTYQFVATLDQATNDQLEVWTMLAGLSGPGRRFAPNEANFYFQTVTKARFLSRFMAGAGLRAKQLATAYRLPVDEEVFRSYADLPADQLCKPISREGAASYGQAPWKGSVEKIRNDPITRQSIGMRGASTTK